MLLQSSIRVDVVEFMSKILGQWLRFFQVFKLEIERWGTDFIGVGQKINIRIVGMVFKRLIEWF